MTCRIQGVNGASAVKVGGGGYSLPLFLRSSPSSSLSSPCLTPSLSSDQGGDSYGAEAFLVLSIDFDADAVTKLLATERQGSAAVSATVSAVSVKEREKMQMKEMTHLESSIPTCEGRLVGERREEPSSGSPRLSSQHLPPPEEERSILLSCRGECAAGPTSSLHPERLRRMRRRGPRVGEGAEVLTTSSESRGEDAHQAPYAVLNLFGPPQLRGRNREPRVVLTTPDARLAPHGVALSNRLIRRGIPVGHSLSRSLASLTGNIIKGVNIFKM